MLDSPLHQRAQEVQKAFPGFSIWQRLVKTKQLCVIGRVIRSGLGRHPVDFGKCEDRGCHTQRHCEGTDSLQRQGVVSPFVLLDLLMGKFQSLGKIALGKPSFEAKPSQLLPDQFLKFTAVYHTSH